jgi:Reeler domain.
MKRIILLTLVAGSIATVLLSNATGPAKMGNGNKTGGPGASGSCNSCHSGGSLANATITVRKKDDLSMVTKYKPGEVYRVELSSMHPTNFHNGFQLMALKSGNTQAGTFQGLSADHGTKVVNGIVIVEHNKAIMQTGASFLTFFEWIAPVAGTGTVEFYGVINAVNNDGGTGGDAVSNTLTYTVAEDALSVRNNEMQAQEIKVYPNPVIDVLHIAADDMAGDCMVSVNTIEGKHLLDMKTRIVAGNPVNINVQDLAKGVYNISIYKQGTKHSTLFVKQ